MLRSIHARAFSPLTAALACAAVAACSPRERPIESPFDDSGELIALSGADAGASNACFTCHGLQGQGNGAGVPRLAGLPVGYLERQMEFYAAGLRRHSQMQAIAGRLPQQERQAVSAYYAGMRWTGPLQSSPASRPPLWADGDPDRGIPPCAACHGMNGEGMGAGGPPVAGQPAPYQVEQMRQWRLGERRGDPLNAMLKISQRLTPSEIDALATYAASLSGDARHREYPAASR